MMTLLVGFLTVVMVLNCIFLILLVLVQLPKKEAGAGLAFGGAATETLFGSGTGTVLTKATKYSAGLFMSLALFLAIVNSHAHRNTSTSLDQELERLASSPPAIGAPASSNTLPDLPPAATPESTTSTPAATAFPTLLLSPTNTPTPAPTNSPPPQ